MKKERQKKRKHTLPYYDILDLESSVSKAYKSKVPKTSTWNQLNKASDKNDYSDISPAKVSGHYVVYVKVGAPSQFLTVDRAVILECMRRKSVSDCNPNGPIRLRKVLSPHRKSTTLSNHKIKLDSCMDACIESGIRSTDDMPEHTSNFDTVEVINTEMGNGVKTTESPVESLSTTQSLSESEKEGQRNEPNSGTNLCAPCSRQISRKKPKLSPICLKVDRDTGKKTGTRKAPAEEKQGHAETNVLNQFEDKEIAPQITEEDFKMELNLHPKLMEMDPWSAEEKLMSALHHWKEHDAIREEDRELLELWFSTEDSNIGKLILGDNFLNHVQ